ncbi:unnamed protein product [Mytilus coruscus]|uniref:Interferon-induced protein 44-like n=1 Tax=Mytilus coruscus TaxID=42192 RepID=A0A6J8CGF1_MYTCO|nr:unnamed protein product [Mytilus coruscus]
MPVANYRNSIYDNADYGPTFGDRDLQAFSGTVNFDGTIFNLNGKTNFGSSYTMNDENCKSIANGNMGVKDIEVYLVEDIAIIVPLYFKRSHEERHMNGTQSIGCTKSEKGVRGKPMNFRLHNTRGIEADQGVDVIEICYLLDGNIQDGYQFNPSVPVSTDTLGFVESAHISETINCVVLVLDGTTVMAEKVAERVKKLQMTKRYDSIPQVVLLTKIDKVCERTEKDLSNVFYSHLVKETVDNGTTQVTYPTS